MTRKYFVLFLMLPALVLFSCSACSPAAADMTPTPDTSIVWEDDFEDADTEGWMVIDGTISFDEGVLTFALDTNNTGGIIYHESNVSVGTWSFDLFHLEDGYTNYEIGLSYDQEWGSGFSVILNTTDNSMVMIKISSDGVRKTGESAILGQKLSSWNHFDITRDDSGNMKFYLDGELILENKDELAFSPQFFAILTSKSGPVMDNLVIRNQVVDIPTTEMD